MTGETPFTPSVDESFLAPQEAPTFVPEVSPVLETPEDAPEGLSGPSPFDLEAFGEPDIRHPDEVAGDAMDPVPSGAVEQVAAVAVLKSPRAFVPEEAGPEPSPQDQRVGRAARMFWLWFAANSSIVSVGFGAMVFSLGMSLRQAIVAVLAGVALSFLPLGLGTLAGKRSGQPTMIVSRATFGIFGNVIPALIALVSRLFWGAVLLWMLGAGTASVLVGARADRRARRTATHSHRHGRRISGGARHRVLRLRPDRARPARSQLSSSGILIAGLIALTFQHVDIRAALTMPDGPWILVVTGAVLVFSFVGLVWANSSGDLARYQRPGSSGAGAMLWASFGATLPSFVLIA